MKFYLIDDDQNIRNILKLIIRERKLGELCGSVGNPFEALEDLQTVKPDIVIVDLLMPEMDGISFVNHAKAQNPFLTFVMLSQVSSKEMISSAYESGIDFYIQKPINSIEVESVLRNVSQKLTMSRTISQVRNLFDTPPTPRSTEPTAEKIYTTHLKSILQKLGIVGEIGSKDIIALIEYLIEHDEVIDDTTLNEICSNFSETPKTVEQRIRRAANTGMVNLAHLGLEDYSNEIFTQYATSLYNFEQIRKEMDYIRGKSDRHGNVKVKNFLNALLHYCKS